MAMPVVGAMLRPAAMSESALGLRQMAEYVSTMMTVASTIRPKSIAPTDKQVGGFAAQHQDADGEEQRKGNGRADDQRAAQIAEEHPLQQEDQHDADDHVVQHGPAS